MLFSDNKTDVQHSWVTAQDLIEMRDAFLKSFYETAHKAKRAALQQAVHQLVMAGADKRRVEYRVMPDRTERIQYGGVHFHLHAIFQHYVIRYEMRRGILD